MDYDHRCIVEGAVVPTRASALSLSFLLPGPMPDRRRKDRLNALARVGTIGAARGLAGEAYLSFYALHASQEKKYKDFPESVID